MGKKLVSPTFLVYIFFCHFYNVIYLLIQKRPPFLVFHKKYNAILILNSNLSLNVILTSMGIALKNRYFFKP